MAATVLEDIRQRHIDAYWTAERDIIDGRQSLDPPGLAGALVAFAVAVQSGKVKPDEKQYNALLGEFASTLRWRTQRNSRLKDAEYVGVAVRAGIRAGIITGVREDDVDEMLPRDVTALCQQLTEAVKAVSVVPGE